MRPGVTLLTVAIAALLGCGGSNSSSKTNAATGSWSETLANSSGQQLGAFTFNLMQNDTMLTGSNMTFSNLGSSLAPCFGAGTVMSGQMGPGMMSGGGMTMTMSSTSSGSALTNTLTLQGNMAMGMGSGSGTFTLTGQTPGCTSQTGTFTMTHTSTRMM